jgi:hypothetical protein
VNNPPIPDGGPRDAWFSVFVAVVLLTLFVVGVIALVTW